MTRPSVPTRTVRRLGVGLLAVALGLLSGCGDDDGADGGAAASASTPQAAGMNGPAYVPGGGAVESGGAEQPAGNIAVTAVDFSLELPTEEVAAGDYTVELTNDGESSHNLVVERDGEDVAGIEAIDPGASATFTVTLEPGEYVFYCSVANHRSMGMEVTVTVT